MQSIQFECETELALKNLAEKLRPILKPPCIIYLQGELGAGKTTFVRYLLQHFEVRQTVISPTYSLVETYQNQSQLFHHFDLYRINDRSELEFLGLRDYLSETAIIFIEWPKCAQSMLPTADLLVKFTVNPNNRQLDFIANTAIGSKIIQQLTQEK